MKLHPTTRRVMGIETEYGVLEPGRPGANPMALSSYVVAAYGAHVSTGRRARWDYDDEDPLLDARGFRIDRAGAHPSLLTDDPSRPAPSGEVPHEVARPAVEPYDDPAAANAILSNGARLYVDHAHPEYSSPEVTCARDGVLWDRAGELVMLTAMRSLGQNPALPDVVLYKNNVDGKGATYGTHENFLVDRAVPFAQLAARIMPFLVTRPVFAGAGRVGIGQRGEVAGFQISQRADYVEAEIGLETTLRRPIVNTRDEPHADPDRWRRLHLIGGDANCLEVATYLKLATTSLVLWLIEQGAAPEPPAAVTEALARVDALALADPVTATHEVSHDLTLARPLELADGRRLTALEIQREYLEAVTSVGEAGADDGETRDVLARWSSLLDRLATDPASCAREVEWLAKLRVLEGLRRRDHLDWGNARLAAVDLQWSDLRPERSLYAKLVQAGAVETLVAPSDVEHAVTEPPRDTRAFFRGRAISRFGAHVSAASWDSVVFDVPGAPTLSRVPMRDPLRGTAEHVESIVEASADASALLAALGGGATH